MKKYLILVLAISLLLTAMFTFAISAEETTASEIDLKIYAKNLALENSIYVSYAVPVEGTEGADSIKMLFWLSPQDSYVYGTQTYELSPEAATSTIGGKQYYVFEFDKLAAKQMTVDIYARVYATDGENEYYSKLDKYSILQYAYNKLGKTTSEIPSETMKNLLNDMLTYGARAQEHFGTNLNRLANANYYQVKINGATLSDGADHGLYLSGTQLSVTAPEKNADGEDFLYWQNSSEEQVGEELTYTITVGEENETYTAVYGKKTPTATDESYFIFTELNDGTYSVRAKDVNNMPAEMVIPSTYNGKAVTSIRYGAFYNCTDLVSVTIPESITIISSETFAKCTNLRSVTIPNSVTKIDSSAFKGCTSLTSITIPDSVVSIGNYAFCDCTGFTSITIPCGVTSIGNGIFWGCTNLTDVTIPDGITSISYGAFYNCTSLSTVTIPNSVTSIGISAFHLCTSLTDIVIPDGVESIGDYTFCDCTGLVNVSIPDSVTSIGYMAFYNCKSLESITIPDSITSIGNQAFINCTSLKTVYYTGTAENWASISIVSNNTNLINATRYYYSENQPTDTIHQYWHYVDGVPAVWEPLAATDDSYFIFTELSDGTYSIKAKDVSNMPSEVTIPSTYHGKAVTVIEYRAFYACSNLISITLPDSVTNIDNTAFCNCTNLKTIILSNRLTRIGAAAFEYCTSLTNIIIPDSVTVLADSAFLECENLETVILGNCVENIYPYAFHGCPLKTVYFSGTAAQWKKITIYSYNTILTNVARYYYSEAEPTEAGNYWHYVDDIPTAW